MKTKTSLWLGSFTALCCFVPMSAHAGFEWAAPAQTAPSPAPAPQVMQPMEDVPAAPAPKVQQAPIMPEPQMMAPVMSQPVPGPVISSPAPAADVLSTQPRRVKPSEKIDRMQSFMKAVPQPTPAPVMAAPVVRQPATVPTAQPKKLFIDPYPNRDNAAMAASVTASQPMERESIPQFGSVQGFGKDLPLVIAMSQIIPANYTYSFADDIDMGARVSWSGGKAWPDVLSEMLEQEDLRYNLASRTVHIARADEGIENIVMPPPAPTSSPAPMQAQAVNPVVAPQQAYVVSAPQAVMDAPQIPLAPVAEQTPSAPSVKMSNAPSMVSRAADLAPDVSMAATYEYDPQSPRPRVPARMSRMMPDVNEQEDVIAPSQRSLEIPDDVLQSPVVAEAVESAPMQPVERMEIAKTAPEPVSLSAPQASAQPMSIIQPQEPDDMMVPTEMDMSEDVMVSSADLPEPPSEPVIMDQPVKVSPAPVLSSAPEPAMMPMVERVPAPLMSAPPLMSSSLEPVSPPARREAVMVGMSIRDMLNQTRTWRAVRGDSLKTVLTDWSNDAGVELYWSSEYDYPLDSSVKMTGTFEDAVKNILTGLQNARPRPAARLHPNDPEGPAVLVVETQQVIE